jgi:hypothetical protein
MKMQVLTSISERRAILEKCFKNTQEVSMSLFCDNSCNNCHYAQFGFRYSVAKTEIHIELFFKTFKNTLLQLFS